MMRIGDFHRADVRRHRLRATRTRGFAEQEKVRRRALEVAQLTVDELVFDKPSRLVKGVDPNGSQRAWDLFVKSRFVEASKTFSATHVKVVTERGVVYLMGLVRRDEGDAAGQVAASTSGVVRVVKLFEYIN